MSQVKQMLYGHFSHISMGHLYGHMPSRKGENMKKSVIELSEDAWRSFRKAKDRYDETMCKLYPAGTRWMCNHGTRGVYEVIIKDYFPSRERFRVENTETHEVKFVHWASFICGA